MWTPKPCLTCSPLIVIGETSNHVFLRKSKIIFLVFLLFSSKLSSAGYSLTLVTFSLCAVSSLFLISHTTAESSANVNNRSVVFEVTQSEVCVMYRGRDSNKLLQVARADWDVENNGVLSLTLQCLFVRMCSTHVQITMLGNLVINFCFGSCRWVSVVWSNVTETSVDLLGCAFWCWCITRELLHYRLFWTTRRTGL